ncbi:MAG: flagellar export chaperone FliS [Thermodesulfobacteriota bacterium]|nr:flagellar export chaperone FliS [Thermodesulfobacteriota bacterium]
MAPLAGINKYLNNHYDGMSPEQLILMLYKGALDRLQLAKQGVQENNIKKRGENLGKVIAIISELNSSVDLTMKDESTQFLRGLYSAILAELPMVSINNDIDILIRTETYISKLKEIWEKDVMGKGQNIKQPAKPESASVSNSLKTPGGYGHGKTQATPNYGSGKMPGGYGKAKPAPSYGSLKMPEEYGKTRSALGSIAV